MDRQIDRWVGHKFDTNPFKNAYKHKHAYIHIFDIYCIYYILYILYTVHTCTSTTRGQTPVVKTLGVKTLVVKTLVVKTRGLQIHVRTRAW